MSRLGPGRHEQGASVGKTEVAVGREGAEDTKPAPPDIPTPLCGPGKPKPFDMEKFHCNVMCFPIRYTTQTCRILFTVDSGRPPLDPGRPGRGFAYVSSGPEWNTLEARAGICWLEQRRPQTLVYDGEI